MKSSLFVSVEGCNASGKSFIVENISEKLIKSFGIQSTVTKQPTAYFRRSDENIPGKYLLEKIIEDRLLFVESILPVLLAQNTVVICDRYIESTLVYQRMDGYSLEELWKLNQHFPIPDLTIIVNCPDQVRWTRLKNRKDISRFEQQIHRDLEQEYYSQACTFLQSKKFNYLNIDSEKCEFDKAIKAILQLLEN
jgi:dTMP kinase